MVSFDPSASSLFSRFNNLVASRGGNTAQSLSQVSIQTKTQSGLSIVTAEGDKVTLSTNTAFQGTGIQYNARGVLEGQALTLRANTLESESISQRQVTIEGDLNEQEVKDIQKIIKQVSGLRNDVKSGNLKAAVANGQQISASGTIASIDVKIQHAESIRLSQSVERRGITNATQAGQPAIQGGEGGPGLVSPQDNLLQGLLASRFLSKPEHEQQDRSGRVPHSHERFSNSGHGKAEESLTQRVKDGLKKGVEGLVEFFNKVGEELLKGAEKIAKLADKLKNKVEKQAARIAKAYERLTGLLEDGKTDKAERLQNKIDRRVNRLENTVEKVSSRINKVAEKLAGKLTNILESRIEDGPSTESSQLKGPREENDVTEAASHHHPGEERKEVTS